MITMFGRYISELVRVTTAAWNRFWFTPTAPHTLAMMRIFAGLMIFYTHLVWSSELLNFFGPEARIPIGFAREFHDSDFGWSHFFWFSNPLILKAIHVVGLLVSMLFAIGFQTRITSVLAFLFAVSYVHRATGALFGLDQINVMLAMYLMLSNCGAVYSVDAWLRRRGRGGDPQPAVMNNVSTRLIQLHMCVIYLFAALGKLQGVTWWDGTAMWLALANYEYQTLDLTGLAAWPLLINFLTHVTLAWELTYSVLIWPKWTRPLMLFLAIPVHLGIALAMGMVTFGLIMLVGNMAFVSPETTEAVVTSFSRKRSGGQSQAANAA